MLPVCASMWAITRAWPTHQRLLHKESWLSVPSSSQLGWAMSFLSHLCWEVVDKLQFYLLQAVSVVMSSWGHEYKGPVDWTWNPIKKCLATRTMPMSFHHWLVTHTMPMSLHHWLATHTMPMSLCHLWLYLVRLDTVWRVHSWVRLLVNFSPSRLHRTFQYYEV